MTTPSAAQDKINQLRQRLGAVLKDLQDAGINDPQTIALVGSLAADISASLGQKSWGDAKQSMSDANYAELLGAFETQGNAFHRDGKIKQAYAVQALALSLVASRHRGQPRIAEGEHLLDGVIEAALTHYNRHLRASAN